MRLLLYFVFSMIASGNTSAAPDTQAPTIPLNLNATAVSPTQINLGWKASEDIGGGVVAGYKVYRDGVRLTLVTQTYFVDTKVAPNTTHSYQVAAFDNAQPANNSPKSIAANTTTPATDIKAPTIPLNLDATAVSPTQINLSWKASSDIGGGVVAGYKVYRDGALFSLVTKTRFYDKKVAPNTAYSYRVAAFDDAQPGNNSPKSTAANTTTPATDTIAPTTPLSLDATAVSPTQINLSWKASWDLGGGVVAGYKVYRDGVRLASATKNRFIDTKVEPNTMHSYRVAAVDDAQPGNNSPKSIAANTVTCDGVDILPSYDAISIIRANPPGTTFCFKAGTHRLSAPIDAHTNDRYIGESGSILDGNDTITHAFEGTAGAETQANVTILGLIIQNFHGIYTDFNTRNTIKTGDNWIVENNEIRYNYETGIHVTPGTVLRNNNIHRNGRYGLTGGPGLNQNILIDGNEIAYNNTRNLSWATAGSAKVVGSSRGATGFTWINNWIHHNNGHGMHHDWNVGPGIEIAFNRIEENIGSGIQHEASWGANIHDNTLINNAKRFIDKSCGYGAQIRLLDSSNVNIYKNYVESTEGANGICLADATNDTTVPASDTITNVRVTRNTIKLVRQGQTGLVGSENAPYTLSDAFFNLNTYYVPDPETGAHWGYFRTQAEWQAKNQDLGSKFLAW